MIPFHNRKRKARRAEPASTWLGFGFGLGFGCGSANLDGAQRGVVLRRSEVGDEGLELLVVQLQQALARRGHAEGEW